MSGTRPAEILRQLEQSAHSCTPSDAVGDAELLIRFVRHRDQGAFTLLVRRYGPMVLAVCRRVTAHRQDAEDAFQAVFLILARKAGGVRTPALVGNWLYGVAVRVARRARRTADRRRQREVQVVDMPEPETPPVDPPADVGPVLHEELAGLPAWYREAVVLCDLRGLSRTAAAAALGIPEGTLSSRLAGGRKKLAARLAQRGVVLSAAAVPAALTGDGVVAAVPESLILKTDGLVADWSAGGLVPPAVQRLVPKGVSMRTLLAAGIVSTVLVTGAVVVGRPSPPPDPPKPDDLPVRTARAAVVAPASVPDPAATDPPIGFTTRPALSGALDLPVRMVLALAWSADGSQLAIQGYAPPTVAGQDLKNVIVLVPDVRSKNPKLIITTIPEAADLIGFTPDGKSVVTETREYELLSGFHRLTFWQRTEDPSGEKLGAVRTVDLDPEPTSGYAFSRNGRSFRTVRPHPRRQSARDQLEVREVSAETGKVVKTLLTVEGEFTAYHLAVSGKQLAVMDAKGQVVLWDVDRAAKVWTTVVKIDPQPGPADPTTHRPGPSAPIDPRPVPADPTTPQLDPRGPQPASANPPRPVVPVPAPRPTFETETPTTPSPGSDREVSLELSPDGSRLICARRKGVGRPVVLDCRTGNPLPGLEEGQLLELDASPPTPDGVWPVRRSSAGEGLTDLPSCGCSHFTRDGRLLVLRGSRYVRLTAREQPRAAYAMPGLEERGEAYEQMGAFFAVWDTGTGKLLKEWGKKDVNFTVCPTRPVVATLEGNRTFGTRLGFWDFTAEKPGK